MKVFTEYQELDLSDLGRDIGGSLDFGRFVEFWNSCMANTVTVGTAANYDSTLSKLLPDAEVKLGFRVLPLVSQTKAILLFSYIWSQEKYCKNGEVKWSYVC